MKILILGPYDSPIIQRLVKNLKNREHEVWLASYNAENQEGIINLGELKSILDFFKMNRVYRLVKTIQPDVVHAHVVNHYGVMAWRQSKPLVVALWGSDVMLAPHSGCFIKKLFYRIVNSFVLKRANLCHTSANHVALEADNQYKGALSKTKVFYWGLPLNKPDKVGIQKISDKLRIEFGISSEEKYVVFPRGLDEIYNPKIAIRIINNIREKINCAKQVVVLKGFCDEEKVKEFKEMIDIEAITYIDRVLSSEELYVLYSNTVAHVSIPTSDSLGGGVVEPSLLGSFPILSNLPSYREFAKENESHVMCSFEESEIQKAAETIAQKLKNGNKGTFTDKYSSEAVIEKIELVYLEAIQKVSIK